MLVELDTRAIADARSELAAVDALLAGTAATDERADLVGRRAEAQRRLDALRDPGTTVAGPADMFGLLDAKVPVALLPIRLETRFADGGDTLRIRVFPDDIGVHTHEPELTDREHDDGLRYWNARLSAPAGEDGRSERLGAWRDIATVHGPARAGWIVDALTPTNLDRASEGDRPEFPDVDRRESPWTRPPRAAAMPERWVAIGIRKGRELFRTWGSVIPDDLAVGPSPDPATDDDGDVAAEVDPLQDDLDLDDAMRWMVDYGEAERVGMAITVGQGDLRPRQSLADGLDRLIVLGVDWSRDADESERALHRLLTAHRHTEGLGFVAPGTPTNATSAAAPAGHTDATAVDACDPAADQPEPSATSDVGRLSSALGLTDSSALTATIGSDRDVGDAAFHVHHALWPATLGYFFQHLLDGVALPSQLEAVRDHFARFVRGSGPLATLRVGDQPYGVLPVVALGGWSAAADERHLTKVAELLADGRGLWANAALRSPRLGRSDDAEGDLLEVLRQTPTMETLRFRTVFGPLLTANTSGLAAASRFQQLSAQWLTGMLGTRTIRSRLLTTTLHPRTRRLTVPLVQADTSGPLQPDYVGALDTRLRRIGGFAAIRAEEPTSLFHALILHGAQLEIGHATLGLIADRPTPGLPRPRVVIDPEPELVDIADADGSAITPARAASRAFTAISGRRPMADHIVTLPQPERTGSTRQFARFRDSVNALVGTPAQELDRLVRETLDCCSYRLDAWATSLATRRLEKLRSARQSGIHLGGFGWVEDLRPDTATAEPSDGYVHVPSLAHAHTAAVLRSGHLEHLSDEDDPSSGDEGGSPLAVDLSSGRVRTALKLLDGMRQGQPFGALLGYRFERALREADVDLARYILPFRRAAPLRTDLGDDGLPGGASEVAIAARDVVDGVILLQRWRAEGVGLLDGVGADSGHRPGLAEQLDLLEELLDAVADVFVAESVYQAVTGNVERAGAAAGALDRQHPATDPDVVRTPRTGADHTYRVAVVLGDATRPAGWAGVPADVRAAAEPRLDAWIARVLGDPRRIRLAAESLDADGDATGFVESTLADVGLSPISVVLLAGVGGVAEASELEEHVVAHLAAQAAGAAQLRLIAGRLDDWAASDLTLDDLLALAGSILGLVGSARELRAADLVLAEQEPVDTADLEELGARVDDLFAAADEVLDRLGALGEAPPPDTVAAVLAAASAVGVSGVGPGAVARVLGGGGDEDGGDGLSDLVVDVVARLRSARERAEGSRTADGDRVAAMIAAIRALLGEDFPVLPLSTLADAEDSAASLAGRASLLDGDELAPTTWMVRRSLVRPAVARLAEVLSWGELCDTDVDATQLAVTQVPYRPGDRWVASDLPADRRLPIGRLSVVAHVAGGVGGLDLTAPWAGLFVDDWGERIPSPVETTGVALQYDAPGARAPQAVLLAVPGDPDSTRWTLDALLDTVVEALDLTRIRAVDPQQLWLAGRMLPALYVAHNIVGDTAALDLFRFQARLGD